MIARGALALVLAASACNDHPNQLVVSFDTDAPVVSSSGDSLDAPTPLFDRLRIDVVPPPDSTVTCDACSNDFAVTREMFASGEVSIGVPLAAGKGWTLRARLYLARFAGEGQLDADSTIDEVVPLPMAADNPSRASVFLATDSVGQPSAPGDLGAVPSASAVGTWGGAARVPCDESSTALPRPSNTACVPGGAYWMGTQDGQPLPGRSAHWHRLAVLSPYYFDDAEVTVGAFRAFRSFASTPNDPADPFDQYCTFTSAPGPYEDLPITCVTLDEARAYCQSRGGDLPTGTQYEFVATRFGRSPYPWGFDQPVGCDAAVWGDCVYSGCFYAPVLPHEPCFTTYASSPLVNAQKLHIGGPVAAPSCAAPCSLDPFRDVLQVGDVGVVDLAANVSELTSERAFSEDDDCYRAHVLTDPSCPSVPNGRAQTRGGAYDVGDFVDMRADTAAEVFPPYSLPDTGFRCAYPAAK